MRGREEANEKNEDAADSDGAASNRHGDRSTLDPSATQLVDRFVLCLIPSTHPRDVENTTPRVGQMNHIRCFLHLQLTKSQEGSR